MRRVASFTPMLWIGLLLTACSVEESVSPLAPAVRHAGTLSMDLRGTASVRIEAERPLGPLSVTVRVDGETLGLFAPGTELSGLGTEEPFPEASLTLYTAKLAAPPYPGGSCGAEPVSIALSLARRGETPRVAGALTVYCGEGQFAGTPKGMLRLSGELPRTP